MNITYTEKALVQLGKLNANSGRIKLRYETDGCGCVMCGINELWLVEQPEADDIEIQTNAGPILVEQSKQVFLDEVLTIDYSESTQMFMLKSPNQILTPRMRVIDKVGVH